MKKPTALYLAAEWIERISINSCHNCPLCPTKSEADCLTKFSDKEDCAPAIAAYFKEQSRRARRGLDR